VEGPCATRNCRKMRANGVRRRRLGVRRLTEPSECRERAVLGPQRGHSRQTARYGLRINGNLNGQLGPVQDLKRPSPKTPPPKVLCAEGMKVIGGCPVWVVRDERLTACLTEPIWVRKTGAGTRSSAGRAAGFARGKAQSCFSAGACERDHQPLRPRALARSTMSHPSPGTARLDPSLNAREES
jgi:hypothetical protein